MTVRTGGFALLIMVFIGLAGIVELSIVWYWFQSSGSDMHDIWLVVLASGIGLYAPYYAIAYTCGHSIHLGDDSVRLSIPAEGLAPRAFPKFKIVVVPLRGIEAMILARGTEVESMARDVGDDKTLMELDDLKSRLSNNPYNYTPYVNPCLGGLAAEAAFRFLPFWVIVKKNGHAVVVNTKPFAKKGFLKLLDECRQRGMPVLVRERVV